MVNIGSDLTGGLTDRNDRISSIYLHKNFLNIILETGTRRNGTDMSFRESKAGVQKNESFLGSRIHLISVL